MVNSTHKFIENKKKQLAEFKPEVTNGHQQAEVASGPLLQEKDEIIGKLKQMNEELTQRVSSLEIGKHTLDQRLLESPALEEMSKQLLEVIAYSMGLKGHLDTAEKVILDIQEKRIQEIKQIHAKYTEEHKKLITANHQFQREISSYKIRNTELQALVENLKMNETQAAVVKSSTNDETANKLHSENTKLKAQLDELHLKYREEAKKVYKYKKELEKTCDTISNRHKHYNEMFSKLLELNKQHGLNITRELEELSKYVLCREDKIKDLEKRWVKAEKEANDEKKKSQDYITMMAETNVEYDKVREEKQRLQAEVAEAVSNLSKILKEKNAEKLAYDSESSKLMNEVRICKERLQATSEKQELLMKNTQAKEKNLSNTTTTFNNLKTQLDTLNEQLTKVALESENRKKELEAREGVLKSVEVFNKKINKELSEFRTQVLEKDKLIENYFKKTNPDIKLDLTKLKADDFVVARLEVEELRKKVLCEVCKKRHKNKIIAKCYHQFCGQCLDDCLERRERKCPTCGEKFSHNDLKQVY